MSAIVTYLGFNVTKVHDEILCLFAEYGPIVERRGNLSSVRLSSGI
jgi:hypothetical protein